MIERKKTNGGSILKILILVFVSLQLAAFPLTSSALAGIEYARIKEHGAKLKSRPSLKTDTIVVIKKGEVVLVKNRLENPEEVSGVKDRWYFVQYKGLSGWIFGASLDMDDPEAKESYVNIESFFERINNIYEMKEAGDLKGAVQLADEILNDVKLGFGMEEIQKSSRLKEIILSTIVVKGECLVFLKRFDEAKEAYRYLLKNYPGAMFEHESIPISEVVKPYLVYMKRFPEAVTFSDPKTGLDRLKTALEKKDLTTVSKLAVPGIFEIWVANTDWMMRLGEKNLKDVSLLGGHWDDNWEVIGVDLKTGDDGEVIGYCIKTGPWQIDYSGRPIENIDFCIDKLPGGDTVFGYIVLYTRPIPE
ncbi:MAG: hypothetical protein JW984_01865 [Deltaproteobacteria bacterium]|uniref:SH3b domain-containing protein n=1 Tax=Candidatus Zymogenus saltonus TaxID=2844893 RepID=A0A9D8PMD5_9DELT|nr:hypothetical protein [Candidatus Zymogenus saltonus]